ncbi:MAG: DNA polymerase III subunit alpha [Desulfobacterales bacterium]|nr:DNA polymerase III subunit alpha [Desulfobacterales bacterium]MDX2509882.1 DNA polymerase III subunit alpha [Desulfobacterales bacterium]
MHLNVHSYYSLRYGTMSPEVIIKEARDRNITAIALTDINTSMGIPDFVKICREENIHPIAGIEFRSGDRKLFTGIAKNREGLRELNEFLSHHNISGSPLPSIAPEFNHAFVIYPFENRPEKKLKEHEYVGIRPGELRKLISSEFSKNRSKLVVQQAVSFIDEKGYILHKHLRAIDHNILLSQLQSSHLARKEETLHSIDKLLDDYSSYPEILRNTEQIVQQCSIDFDIGNYKNKKTFTGNSYDDKLLLEKLAMDGLVYRYGKQNKEALKRIQHELKIIHKMEFSSYFLITWDIIRYSMSRDFYHVGRGSGANSIVAYCLRITDVDPIELNLFFERFINPKRTSPPDFDIDYSWKERDDVLDYMFKRYGHQHTALLGATSTFKGKSIIRELGKVYGLPKPEIDSLIDYPDAKANQNEITDRIFKIGFMMTDFPNLRSIHAGGVLISEEPISYYTALDMPPKGFQTTQWDMYVAENLGFEKFDILSQRGIGHIKECASIVQQNRGITVDVHAIQDFKKDKKVKRLLREGETTGCFYIESPAMRGLLQKLRCDNYIDLVAASSIIRPGVARSGMMREYIQRFHNPHGFDYLHPVMQEQLQETFGVMVYQEDVLKVCHHFAGLGLAEADVLRRAMSGKHRSKTEFKRIVDQFFSNCADRGYPDDLTREVWRQIESFAGYSFSKAHSASYAVESFQSLFLKTYYPLEFAVAVINNFGGFYRTWVYVNEAKKYGGIIELPSVNHSEYKTSLSDKQIYLGFIHIHSLEQKTSIRIFSERQRAGKFMGLDDFVNRVHIGIEQLLILIRTDAFRFTGKSKKQLLWNAHLLLNPASHKKIESIPMFRLPTKDYQLPPLIQNRVEDAFDEIELIGFPVTVSWFELLQTKFRGQVLAKDLKMLINRKVKMVGQLVTIKYIKTKNRDWMHFGAFHDVKGDFFDTVHFPQSLKKYPFKGSGIYLILGKVVEEFGFASIEVEKLAKLPIVNDPRYG